LGQGIESEAPNNLLELLPADAVRMWVTVSDWRTAVRAAGEALTSSGATSIGYTDEMIACVEEFGPYIVIAPGIALAHARPSSSVHRAGLSWVRLGSPVEFGHESNDPVSLVIGLAAPDDSSHMTALSTLAELLSDDAARSALMEATFPGRVRDIIRAHSGADPDGKDA